VRERLERRLAAAEGAAVARGEDAAKMTVRQAEQEMSCDERDAAATRQGEASGNALFSIAEAGVWECGNPIG